MITKWAKTICPKYYVSVSMTPCSTQLTLLFYSPLIRWSFQGLLILQFLNYSD